MHILDGVRGTVRGRQRGGRSSGQEMSSSFLLPHTQLKGDPQWRVSGDQQRRERLRDREEKLGNMKLRSKWSGPQTPVSETRFSLSKDLEHLPQLSSHLTKRQPPASPLRSYEDAEASAPFPVSRCCPREERRRLTSECPSPYLTSCKRKLNYLKKQCK